MDPDPTSPTVSAERRPAAAALPSAGAQPLPPTPLVDPQIQQEYPHRRRRPRHSHGSHFKRGRMAVVGIFLALRAVDLALYLLVNADPIAQHRPRLYSFIVTLSLWTTSLLVAMWLRQNWARYLLISLVLVIAIVELAFFPDFFGAAPDTVTNITLAVTTLIHAAIAYVLIAVGSVRRLTSQAYE